MSTQGRLCDYTEHSYVYTGTCISYVYTEYALTGAHHVICFNMFGSNCSKFSIPVFVSSKMKENIFSCSMLTWKFKNKESMVMFIQFAGIEAA